MTKEKLLTVKEMAERLNRCERTFRKYVRQYKIPHIRLGRDMLFNPSEVENFLLDLTMDDLKSVPLPDTSKGTKSKIKINLKELDKSPNKYANLLGLS